MATPNHTIDLIFKYLENKLTAEEKDTLFLWINESEINKEIFDKLVSGELLETLSEAGKNEKQQEWDKLEKKYFKVPSPQKNRVPFYYIGLIILVLLCAIVYVRVETRSADKSRNEQINTNDNDQALYGVILTLADGSHVNIDTAKDQIMQCNAVIKKHGNQISYESAINNNSIVEYNSIQTNTGRIFQIALPDKSKVWLNATSSIRYPTAFGSKERKVQVTGEAYFEISTAFDITQNKIPFKVETNGIEITVLGTHFNISSYPNEMTVKTTLLEGCIKIRKGESSYLLSPGQQAQINSEGKISIQKNIEVDEVLAWKNDLFIFNDLQLESAMREIARWYGVDVVYEDYIMKRLTTTIPRHMSLPDVLDMLGITTGLTFKLEGNQIKVKK